MGIKIFGIILIILCVIAYGALLWMVLDFFIEIPKQLKRIADALEKDGDNDG